MQRTQLDTALGSWRAWHDPEANLRVGVSSCLLGEMVRHDGGHTRDRFVVDVLGRWVEWVSVCPEVGIGMGVPRPTIRLVDEGGDIRLVAPSTGEDHTKRIQDFATEKVTELQDLGLDGYVLKKSSPSCGMERLKIYKSGRPTGRNGRGMFASILMERWPGLPMEEDGRLNDAGLRENFIERLFCRNRWRTLVRGGRSRKRLVQFHTAHKLLLRAHDETGYRELGRIAAVEPGGRSAGDVEDLFGRYEGVLATTMSRRTTPRKHANVLQHAMGHLKKQLDAVEKRELLTAIDDYRLGILPLIVPLTLLRYNIVKHDVEYLKGQLYFDPHPKELMLRNHV